MNVCRGAFRQVPSASRNGFASDLFKLHMLCMHGAWPATCKESVRCSLVPRPSSDGLGTRLGAVHDAKLHNQSKRRDWKLMILLKMKTPIYYVGNPNNCAWYSFHYAHSDQSPNFYIIAISVCSLRPVTNSYAFSSGEFISIVLQS